MPWQPVALGGYVWRVAHYQVEALVSQSLQQIASTDQYVAPVRVRIPPRCENSASRHIDGDDVLGSAGASGDRYRSAARAEVGDRGVFDADAHHRQSQQSGVAEWMVNARNDTKLHAEVTMPCHPTRETAAASETAAAPSPFDAQSLRARLDSGGPPLVGLEEELMVVHPHTLDLLPSAPTLLERLAGDSRFKLELPACQIEIVTPPRHTIDELLEDLMQARRRLALAGEEDARMLGAGVHPSAHGEGELNLHGRYREVASEYPFVARRQMVCGLHVHVSLSGADRTLAVYNAMRSYLPLLAALATNAPIYDGGDTGLMSIRPLVAGLLPRQGIPPRLESWEQLCAELNWGAQTGRLLGVQGWWWELRIHPELATLEVRVADAQSASAETAAVAAVAASLVLRLAELHDAGELEPSAPGWRIAENRWSAVRDGAHGEMHDLVSGRPRATRELLVELIEQLQTTASAIGGEPHLTRAMRMLEHNGADRQRELLRSFDDHHAVARALTHLFLAPE